MSLLKPCIIFFFIRKIDGPEWDGVTSNLLSSPKKMYAGKWNILFQFHYRLELKYIDSATSIYRRESYGISFVLS